MIKLILIFLGIALIAGALGFTGIAGGELAIAKIIFFVALAIFLIFLIFTLLGIDLFI